LGARLEGWFGLEHRKRYWQIFEELRTKFGVADYLGSLQAFRDGVDDDPRLLQMSQFLLEFPFPKLLFPGRLRPSRICALRAPGHFVGRRRGVPAAQDPAFGHLGRGAGRGSHLSAQGKGDGSCAEALSGPHYVVVDDKPNLLAAMKLVMRKN